MLEELADRQVTSDADDDADDAGLPLLPLLAAAVAGAVVVGGGGLAVSRLLRSSGRHSAQP